MRLTCPNCGTQYEVDASAIPVAGRDVQCGSCSTTWFQPPEGVKLPPELERSGLRDWEAAESNQVPDLPGDTPEIDTAPNDDIISEPELEELIETSALVEQDVAPDPVAPAPEPAAPPPSASIKSQALETAPEPETAQEDKTSAQAAIAAAAAGAALAKSVAGVTKESTISNEPMTSEFETAATQIEEASTPPSPEFVEDMLQEDLEHGVEELERLDGVSDDDSAQTMETDVEASISASAPSETQVPEIQTVEEPPVANVVDEIRAAAEDLAPENKPGSPLPEDLSQERLADYDFVEGTVTSDVETIDEPTVEGAAPDLSDVEAEVEAEPAKEQEADGYSTEELRDQVRSAMDNAIEDQSSKLVSGTFGEGSNPDLDDEIGVTESLAAKLKARVAEAAEAQSASETKAGQTGTLLAASATGIAAAAGQRVTEFPKRDTEDLSTSLRPKSLARSGLKPGLRPAATPEPKQSKFRSGFVLAIVIFSILVLLYVFRTQIGQLIPALADPLSAYGQAIDKIRLIIQDSAGQLIG